MKLKIAIAACLIFLIGCKTKEIKTINKIETDSSSHVEIKKNIEILTLQTDTGLIVEEETTDYEISTDSAGTKTSIPIKKVKKKWHKYKSQIRAAERQEIKADQKVIIKKEIKTQRVEKAAFQFKWFLIVLFICLLLLLILFLYLK
jgi:hypothetical protein